MGRGSGLDTEFCFFGILILQLEELHLCASRGQTGDGKEEYTDTSHRYPEKLRLLLSTTCYLLRCCDTSTISLNAKRMRIFMSCSFLAFSRR